jgi:hypothetical protein
VRAHYWRIDAVKDPQDQIDADLRSVRQDDADAILGSRADRFLQRLVDFRSRFEPGFRGVSVVPEAEHVAWLAIIRQLRYGPCSAANVRDTVVCALFEHGFLTAGRNFELVEKTEEA